MLAEKISALQMIPAVANSNKNLVFFYEGGGRSKVLSQIFHCIRFNPGAIVLTGPTGSGRSLIIENFARSFKEEGDLCLLSEDSMVLETEEELYRALAHGFGLEEKTAEIQEDLIDRVQHFIRVGLDGKRNLVIAIDDAKQHSLDVLEWLLQLLEDNKGLSVLLAGEAGLFDTLKQFHAHSFLTHHISLRPLLTEEVFEFVRQYLMEQGVSDDLILNRKKIDELMSRTGGNLSLLVHEIQRTIVSLRLQNKRETIRLPIAHMVALVIVIVFTVLAFFYYPGTTRSNINNNSVENDLPKDVAAAVVSEQISAPGKSELKLIETEPASGRVMPAEKIGELSAKNAIILSDLSEGNSAKKKLSHAVSPYTQEEQELLNMPSSHVSLQVSSLSSESAVKAFMGSLVLPDKTSLRYYRRDGKNGKSYVVLYGDYISKE